MAIKTKKKVVKYKAVDPDNFVLMYTVNVPEYDNLCKGEAVSLDENNKIVQNWLINNIIEKE